MTRTENDLRAALTDLEQRADQHGAPSTESIVATASEARHRRAQDSAARRLPRWLPPLAAAAVVAAAAIVVVTVTTGSSPHHRSQTPALGRSSSHVAAPPVLPTFHPVANRPTPKATAKGRVTVSPAAAILDDAAAKLDAAPVWHTPPAKDFFYVHSTDVTTWTSVSGAKAGDGKNSAGVPTFVPGCKHGHIVSSGETGTCTLDDVSRYLADAPIVPADWDAYLEQIAPGAKAANAQGKIIVQVLHEDLTAPKARAALLRYTATGCAGLHTLTVAPVDGEKLVGVTCASMTNGSYGLVFDASTHAFVGFVVVNPNGKPDGSAEVIVKTGIVAAIGQRP